jgi:tetratricopeptide (TPR) repeat protein
MQLFKKLILIYLLSALSVCFAQKVANKRFEMQSSPDILLLRNMLRNRQYQPLLDKLDRYLSSAIQDFTSEKYLWQAFSTFETPHKALEPFLNEMVKQFPTLSNAYAARALYYMTVGWDTRGYGWAKNISQAQWDGMHKYFNLAVNDALTGINLNKQNLMCYYILIKIWMHFSDGQIIRMYLNQALEVSPFSLYIRLAYMYTLLPRWGGSEEEMLSFAKESEEFASRNPRLKVLYGYIPFNQGWEYESKNEYKIAISFFNKALSFGDLALFYEHRGDCYNGLDEYQKALNDYDRSLQLIPQDADVLRKKGMILHTLGRSDEARLIMETASKLNPTDKYVQRTKERIDEEGANEHITKGVELDNRGMYAEAILEYDQAITEQPDDYLGYYDRGVALMKIGKLDEAIRDFEHAIARNVGYVSAHNNIGWIKLQQKKLDDAITAYTKAINLDPKKTESYLNRAYAYYLKNNLKEAGYDLKQACDLGSTEACNRYKELTGN